MILLTHNYLEIMNKIISSTFLATVITLGLTSCIPAALVAGAAAGGVIVSDQRDMKTIWKDNDISYKAQVGHTCTGIP